MVTCKICGREYGLISHTHLRQHQITVADYRIKFPDSPIHSEESKNKQSLSMMGKRHRLGCRDSEETRKKKSLALIGNKRGIGVKRNEEFREKLSKRMLGNIYALGYRNTEETRKLKSLSAMGNKSNLGRKLSPESVQKRADKNRGQKRSDESRRRMSIAQAKRIINGRGQGLAKGYIKGYYFSPKAGKIYYMSSWEQRAFQLLDQDPSVISFKTQPFRIALPNGRNYIPDILVIYLDKLILIEIKPSGFLGMRDNPIKFQAARDYCSMNNMKFEIWTEKQLFSDHRDGIIPNIPRRFPSCGTRIIV